MPLRISKSGFITSLRQWYSGSIKNKIMISVLLVFLAIYGATLNYNYIRNRDAFFESARQEALSTAQILAVTLYRNYEIESDFREIQSYISGAKIYKDNILEINVLNRGREIVSSTNNENLFRMLEDKVYNDAINNKGFVQIVNENTMHYIHIVYPVSAGSDEKHFARGAIEIKTNLKKQIENLNKTRNTTYISGIAIIIAITLVIIFISSSITRPINKLYAGIVRANDGDLDVQVPPTSRDEIGFLTSSFNEMIVSIKSSKKTLERYADNLEKLNKRLVKMMDSSTRFVPMQFLNLLEKKDITYINLGDAVLKNMTVLFMDIRNFTAMSEKMSAENNLKFINSLLNNIIPAISKYNGFIDKYIGDAIMALFPEKAEDALNAAVAMRQALKEYNRKRKSKGLIPVDFGIGINTGEVIIWQVGSKGRMDTTVIGNTVNLASRLEGLTKDHDIPIIFSEFVYRRITNASSLTTRIKEIGVVKVKGLEKPIKLFGVSI